MENIKLIVDSSANMNNDPARNLEVVPLTISFGGKDYLDNQDLNMKEFLSNMNQIMWQAKQLVQVFKHGLTHLKEQKKRLSSQ